MTGNIVNVYVFKRFSSGLYLEGSGAVVQVAIPPSEHGEEVENEIAWEELAKTLFIPTPAVKQRFYLHEVYVDEPAEFWQDAKEVSK